MSQGIIRIVKGEYVPVMTPSELCFPPHEAPFAYRKSDEAMCIMMKNDMLGETITTMVLIAVIAHVN